MFGWNDWAGKQINKGREGHFVIDEEKVVVFSRSLLHTGRREIGGTVTTSTFEQGFNPCTFHCCGSTEEMKELRIEERG